MKQLSMPRNPREKPGRKSREDWFVVDQVLSRIWANMRHETDPYEGYRHSGRSPVHFPGKGLRKLMQENPLPLAEEKMRAPISTGRKAHAER